MRIVRDPGKFEGQPIVAKVYWELFLNGCYDDMGIDKDGTCHTGFRRSSDDIPNEILACCDLEDIDEIDEIKEYLRTHDVSLCTDDFGFVYLIEFTGPDDYDQFFNALNADVDE